MSPIKTLLLALGITIVAVASLFLPISTTKPWTNNAGPQTVTLNSKQQSEQETQPKTLSNPEPEQAAVSSTKPEPKPEPQTEPDKVAVSSTKPEPQPEPQTEPDQVAVSSTKPEPQPEPQTEPEQVAVSTTKPEPQPEPQTKPEQVAVSTAKPEPQPEPQTKPEQVAVSTAKPEPQTEPELDSTYTKKAETNDERSEPLLPNNVSAESAPHYYNLESVTKAPGFNTSELSKQIVYPPLAKKQNREGTVVLRLYISKAGVIDSIAIEQDPGYQMAKAALSAFEGIQVQPAEINGRPAAVQLRFPVQFSLK